MYLFLRTVVMKKIGFLILFMLFSTSTLAECNFKKAARNKMLDNKIGISGSCDTEKAVKRQTINKIDDTLNIDSKKIKNEGIDKKVSTTKKVIDAVK